jgi:hypothetical protein
MSAVNSEPNSSGSDTPLPVALRINITTEATMPAPRPARKPSVKGLFLRENASFILQAFDM